MKRTDTKTEVVLSAIRNSDGDTSFDALNGVTGLNIDELATTIGMLVMKKQILVRLNHSVEKVCAYKSSGDALYERFMDLLFLHRGKKRSVIFYASQLYITPKYLCAVVKKASGKTPTEWINEETVREIECRLCHTQASLKEIAYELNFPSLSFFGKYFKSAKGVSPKRYRENYINKCQSLCV